MRRVAVLPIAVATSGAISFITLAIVSIIVSPSEYTSFVRIWSTLYLFVGTLVGLQQEITRATTPSRDDNQFVSSRNFLIFSFLGATAFSLLLLISMPAWLKPMTGSSGIVAGGSIIIGVFAYALLAAMSGTYYAFRNWKIIGVLLVTDSVLRLVLIWLTFTLFGDEKLLPVAMVAPFVICLLLLLVSWSRKIRNRFVLDSGKLQLAFNSFRTVIAAFATTLLVSGFPALVAMASSQSELDSLNTMIPVLVLVRSPLIIVALSMQTAILMAFRRASSFGTTLKKILLLTAAATALSLMVTSLGFFIAINLGVQPESNLFWLLESFIISSALIAFLTISGSAALARGMHTTYLIGWGVAAGFSILILLIAPFGIDVRAVLSAILGPFIGLVVQMLQLKRMKRTS